VSVEKSLDELAALLNGKVIGDGNVRVTGIASLEKAKAGDLTFLSNPRYASMVASSLASAVLVPKGIDSCGKSGIEVANPYLAFAMTLTCFLEAPSQPGLVMEGAHVGKNVRMGQDVTVYPGAYVGNGVTLGDRVVLYPGAILYDGVVVGDDVTLHAHVCVRERCRIGNRVTIHPGAVVGGDGFGYAPDGAQWYKIPQVGIVVIEDDVEIGCNSTIDRAALDVTRIGRGTKIDNLVMIAHNCVIGEDCVLAGQVGIAGSSSLGNHVTLAGQVGVVGHIKVGNNVTVGAKSAVASNTSDNIQLSGIPAYSHKEWLKVSAIVPRLPNMRKNVAALEKRLRELEEKIATLA
jgi:UDP-3-O-[3-hydroxymyristoyl] glucosamine N-acyltransferase